MLWLDIIHYIPLKAVDLHGITSMFESVLSSAERFPIPFQRDGFFSSNSQGPYILYLWQGKVLDSRAENCLILFIYLQSTALWLGGQRGEVQHVRYV